MVLLQLNEWAEQLAETQNTANARALASVGGKVTKTCRNLQYKWTADDVWGKIVSALCLMMTKEGAGNVTFPVS